MKNKEIAPLLLQIGKLCDKYDMSLFATVEYLPNEFDTTMTFKKWAHIIFTNYNVFRQCIEENGINIDKYFFWLIKTMKGKKHSSMFLYRLGIPTNPNNGKD